jgi:hypothetical protein
MATKFTLCQNNNLFSNSQPISNKSYLTYNGFTYSSLEEFDANNMPRHIFMDKPNVVVAYAGSKIVNGVDTGIPCVVIGVAKKDPNISSKDMIPSVLPDGVLTDVVIHDEIRAIGTCVGDDSKVDACSPHGDAYRPLIGGISAIEESGTACTLGLVVKDNTDESLVALTNNHCAGLQYDPLFDIPGDGNLDTTGLFMMQPSPSDGGLSPADRYGTVKRAVSMQFGIGGVNSVDCAISTIAVDDADSGILGINDGPFPFAVQSEYDIGTEIIKSGRTTGIVDPPLASVTSMAANVNVTYGADSANFINQMIYSSATAMVLGGDSGAAVLSLIDGEIKVIGLNFAGNSTGTLGVANHINVVATQMNIVSWDGDIIVPDTLSDAIEVNGNCYSRVGDVVDPISHTVDAFYNDCDECLGLDNSSSSSSFSSSSSSTQEMSSSTFSSASTQAMSTSSQSSSSTINMSTSSESSDSTQIKSSSSSSFSSDFDIIENIDKAIITHFEITVNNNNEIELSWREVKGASGYSLERKDGFSWYEEIYDEDDIKYLDKDVVAGLFYAYRIRAFYEYPDGERHYGRYSYSDTAIFAPLQPSDLVVVKSGSGLYLSWLDNSSYEDGFVIQRKSPEDLDWGTIAYARMNRGFFLDEDITVEGVYEYRVMSYITMKDQTLLYSVSSNEVAYDIMLSDISGFSSPDIIFVDAGQTSDIEVNYNESVRIVIEGISDQEVFWFMDNNSNSISSFGNVADVFIFSSNDFSLRIEQQGSDIITNINVQVDYVDFRNNPKKPTNIKGRLGGGLLGIINWNSDGANISHFNIYRSFKGDSNLIKEENLVGTVSNSSNVFFSFLDTGLGVAQDYVYTVVSISSFGKTSLFNGSLYVGYDRVNVSTKSVELAILPPSSFVVPNGSVSLSSTKPSDWSFQENNSGSELIESVGKTTAQYLATDSWGANDVIKAEYDGKTSFSQVIITEII